MSWHGNIKGHREAALKRHRTEIRNLFDLDERQTRKFNFIMNEFVKGRLTSRGKVIKNHRQAVAIAFAMTRKV